MTTPTHEPANVPEDVMQAAREAAAKTWADTGGEALAAEFGRGMRDESGSVETAVAAILAERERSANEAHLELLRLNLPNTANMVRSIILGAKRDGAA